MFLDCSYICFFTMTFEILGIMTVVEESIY